MADSNKIYDVIVIGGGSAGLMAASQAGKSGKKVLILEKNRRLGEKLNITGGGRCNITSAEYDTRAFLDNYGDSKDFLFSPFSKFAASETFSFFESLGLPLVIQARNRVFPASEKASDVTKVLKENLDKNNVQYRLGCTVKKIVHKDKVVISVLTNQGEFRAKSFILATGGMSHPETGSTGDGFLWLEELGHTVKTPTPSIVPLEVKEAWVKKLPGISLSFMRIAFYLDDKKQFSKLGKVLFTHFGLSGPLILNSATKVGDLLQQGEVTALIDAYPDTDLGALDQNILHVFDQNKNKTLRTIFKDIVPLGTAPGIQSLLADIDFDTRVHSISREDRKKIVNLLKSLPVTITNLMGYDRAVIADGGVALTEIDTKTMRSKLFNNLYIVGDLLNINRPSGGFSLQLCWTTGFVAGNSA